jgi:hypothetical protein
MPGELEKIRTNIQQQIQQRLQTKAKDLTQYEQWRRGLTSTQQRQLRGKVQEANEIVTGGLERDLINEPPGPTAPPPPPLPPTPNPPTPENPE